NFRTRRLRIWCAGCADGAEPYSLSILLRRELAHLLFGWEVSILGTDINRQSLAIAREGRFEAWSLRATPEHLKQACFVKHDKHWTITPEYKAGISFQFHNLAEHSFPTHAGDPSPFDLIICRNVMIYFGPHLMDRIVRQFHACLAPGAWLLVGPSEPNMTSFTSFHAVNAPGVTLYQRPGKTIPDFISPLLSFPEPAPPKPAVAQSVELPPALSADSRPLPTLADLRKCIDQGDLENAARCGKELVESDKLNALVHFHYALVMDEMGDATESEKSLRRAIYLDRQSVLPHYHLGRLLQARGDGRQAARCFENALNLLELLPSDSVFPDSDGITAAELRRLAQMQIESLKERA
ncbi:MAG TPA: CheR family methyltransferase, partial [Terriglobales bacterium]|nr:CheR family methyltransferase [Terriglobales bacterium]